jgi:hypothetical protein
MKSRIAKHYAPIPAIALITVLSIPAHAVTLQTVPSSVYQLSTTSMFYLGHTVVAGTNISRMTAGGSFNASCPGYSSAPVTGDRWFTSEVFGKYNQAYVTIPQQLPALREMPGFDNASRGARWQCYYNWTSWAREATYTVGIPGSSITIGGGEANDSGVLHFQMQKPGTATGDDDACIP